MVVFEVLLGLVGLVDGVGEGRGFAVVEEVGASARGATIEAGGRVSGAGLVGALLEACVCLRVCVCV